MIVLLCKFIQFYRKYYKCILIPINIILKCIDLYIEYAFLVVTTNISVLFLDFKKNIV